MSIIDLSAVIALQDENTLFFLLVEITYHDRHEGAVQTQKMLKVFPLFFEIVRAGATETITNLNTHNIYL